MRLLSPLAVSLLATVASGQSDLPPPGEPALDYADGSFLEPNGETSSYNPGNKMNISWEASYETTNIYLIKGYQWGELIQITTNSAQTWVQWEVATDSTNSSEIYVFRAVNGTGTAEQKALGGFLSAAFNIPVKESTTTSPSSSFSTLSTSASVPTKTPSSDEDNGSNDPESTPFPTSEPDAGLSEGAKIGIGVGVGIGVLGVAALAAGFLLWRKARGRQQASDPQPYEMPLNGDFSPQPQNAQPYNANPLAGYYKPPETGETRGAELDAGQGYQFIPEANAEHKVPRAELQ
ncbi:hypothetical protein F4802DRAFT_439535 [Xylaria palmicola]|nr:hypothetical protein F4802DRAFT_439535 [Xylaria palmicola]